MLFADQLTLIPLGPEHAADAAWLHIIGQPGSFLTSLGADALTVVYQQLPRSPVGFGFAAVDPARSQELLGFVSATTNVGALFFEMGARRMLAFAPPLLRRFFQSPDLALRAVQTAAYPFLHATSSDGAAPAELLSIMVRPEVRSVGLGALLVSALKAECQRRHITALDVTVAAANDGAQRFYVRHGFAYKQSFTLYGQSMHLYRADIAAHAE
jgi:ribosomal protein S18 acetylase RimI-like enzyme